jgi:hypothetical protein
VCEEVRDTDGPMTFTGGACVYVWVISPAPPPREPSSPPVFSACTLTYTSIATPTFLPSVSECALLIILLYGHREVCALLSLCLNQEDLKESCEQSLDED